MKLEHVHRLPLEASESLEHHATALEGLASSLRLVAVSSIFLLILWWIATRVEKGVE